MSTSPTPEEREKKDAEAKAKEQQEQAKLPYKWTQNIGDLDITVPVPGNLKGRDLEVSMTRKKLKVGIKGQPPIIDVSLSPYSPPSPPLSERCTGDCFSKARDIHPKINLISL